MMKPFRKLLYVLLLTGLACASACNDEPVQLGEKTVVATPEDIDRKAEDLIQGALKQMLGDGGHLADSFRLRNPHFVKALYEQSSFKPLWSAEGKYAPWADSLVQFIDSSRYFGLFPEAYHQERLHRLQGELKLDTSREARLDAARWAYSDLLMTAAFIQLSTDLSRGRLFHDTVLAKDTALSPHFFKTRFGVYKDSGNAALAVLQPLHSGYWALKEALPRFLEKADLRAFTHVNPKDSARLPATLYKRLAEEDSLGLEPVSSPDSLSLASALRKYQKLYRLKVDGKWGPEVITHMNLNDLEKFIRIAITLDRYKSLPALPDHYIWVNIPSYYLQVKRCDTVVLSSRIVVGKPETRTPQLTSAITDMITYPKWHIPESIIEKEILPGLKRDPEYTIRKGYGLFDKEGNEIDPRGVSWAKYSKSIPYRVIQGSGDANALGILKFNFPNKYAVYLHDTNQRSLFGRSKRALSHGCVRVQSWQQLAHHLLVNDSLLGAKNAVPLDSLDSWLLRKEKHTVPVRKRMPLYIRYFTCEVKDDRIVFHEDIYAEDQKLRGRIYSQK